MILVIADDLTGAAEISGLALKYNLAAEITTRVNPASDAELLIIATDTRSLSKKEAEAVMNKVSSEMSNLRPRLIFKKIDSVLRGHVLAEINIQKKKLNLTKALIVPANPGLGRTVVDGTYLLDGKPLHLSSFSQDPEFPISSSRVPQMLYANEGDIKVLKNHEVLPEDTSIIVGEVKDAEDLAAWCTKIDEHTLVAGAAEFFEAVLHSLNFRPAAKPLEPVAPQPPFLAVWGSSYKQSRSYVKKIKDAGFPVSYMPPAVIKEMHPADPLYRRWINEVTVNLQRYGRAGIAMETYIKDKNINALAIRTKMAEAVALIAQNTAVKEFLIEGGSTAAAIIRRLGIETLYPAEKLAPGVTRMKAGNGKDWYLTLKPGSYEWPSYLLHPEYIHEKIHTAH